MEPTMRAFCSKERWNKIDELSAELWQLQSQISCELTKEEYANTYEPIVELLKQASSLLDIASNICYYGRPF